MGELAKHLNELTIRALSPDKRIRAVIKGRGQAVTSFVNHEDFHRYPDGTSVCDQASQLLNRVYKGLEQGRDQVVARHSQLGVNREPHWDLAVRRMYSDIDNLVVDGDCHSGLVRVEAIGFREWRVRMRPGVFATTGAAQFCAGVNACVRDAYQKYVSDMRSLKIRALHGLEPDTVQPA